MHFVNIIKCTHSNGRKFRSPWHASSFSRKSSRTRQELGLQSPMTMTHVLCMHDNNARKRSLTGIIFAYQMTSNTTS